MKPNDVCYDKNAFGATASLSLTWYFNEPMQILSGFDYVLNSKKLLLQSQVKTLSIHVTLKLQKILCFWWICKYLSGTKDIRTVFKYYLAFYALHSFSCLVIKLESRCVSIYYKTFHCLLAKKPLIKQRVFQISSICSCSHAIFCLKQSDQCYGMARFTVLFLKVIHFKNISA